MEIRAARASDAGAIRAVHCAAFPTSAEADLVERLERDRDCATSLVAVTAGKIVGHLLLSSMSADGGGRELKALGLAPVAVIPERQREGIGSALIEAALRDARSAGTDMVFVLGDPHYYRRFGFEAATAAPFASPYAGPYFQALLLRDDVQLPALGRADYAPAFAELA